MGLLYGNTTRLNQTHFQFDKIYPNRFTMDSKIWEDDVFSGRFVLVEYDPKGEFTESNVMEGYKQENDGTIYIDKDCEYPYIYANLEHVNTPLQANWNLYYVKYGTEYPLYYKLPNESYFNYQEKNYYKLSDSLANQADYIITDNQIVRIKNNEGKYTGEYYQCVGEIQGAAAAFERIDIPGEEREYYLNYNIDKLHYGEFSDYGPGNRGYDGTVWQKVYSGGTDTYVLIAHLNAMIPTFDIVADPPSILPKAPYIDAQSTDEFYRLHMPSQWGFRIKEAESVDDGNGNITYPKSDQNVIQTYYQLNETTQELEPVLRQIPAEIYFNKDGFIKIQKNYDNNTNNEILISPTGESGKIYYNANGEQIKIDTYELSVHLPILGNLVSDFYDIFYSQDRNLDINWYDGNDIRKDVGDSSLNGKTRNLNTAAGLINTYQDRLGQIIVPITTLPSAEQILGLNPDYIYSIYNTQEEKNHYYRIGNGYEFKEVLEYEEISLNSNTYEQNKYYLYNPSTETYSSANGAFSSDAKYYKRNITYIADTTILEEQYSKNTYYIERTDNHKLEIANSGYSYYLNNENYVQQNNLPVFYKKNISNIKYIETSLIKYEQNKYFYYRDHNYYLDHSEVAPTYPNDIYYNITEDNWLNSPITFTSEYTAGAFYYQDGKNYLLAIENTPDVNRIYYSIQFNLITSSSNEIPYQPGKYYFQDGDNWKLDNDDEGFVNGREYYYIPFDTSKLITVYDNETGNIITGYALDIANKQKVNLRNWGDLVYAFIDGNYIDITTLDTLNVSYSNYRTISLITEQTSFFLPNQYYTYTEDGYFLATYFNQNTQYYQLSNIQPLSKPFYESDKYYYNNGNLYVIDDNIIMTNNRTYYIESGLYVLSDYSARYNIGYEWKDQALFVPASVTLATRESKKEMFEIENIDNGKNSINGNILQFSNLLDSGNIRTRDVNTIQGSLNTLQDQLKNFINLYPGRMLYINDFGQITASTITYNDLKQLFDRVQILESV